MDDLLYFNQELSTEELMLKENVRKFVVNEVDPIINDCFETATFPKSLIKKIADAGFLGITLPFEFGGSQASYLSYGLLCQELERGDSAIRSFVSVQSSLCMFPIFKFGTQSQCERFLSKMAKGEIIGCFGLTEPDSGSDPKSMRTVAKKVDGGFKLSGTKLWITNATIADIAIIWAKMDEEIHGFIVDTKSQGFSATEIAHKMSLRASVTGELSLDEVFVPEENILPDTKGLGSALSCLNQARFGIAWGAMGAAEKCFEIARDYLTSRKQFGVPLAQKQLIQHDLARIYTEIVKAQWLNLQVARLKGKHQDNHVMISLIKNNSCRESLKILRTVRNLLGANGISLEYNVIRHMLNMESVYTYEGTDNVHTLVLGQFITNLNSF